MKLIRFGNKGSEKPGVLIDGRGYDVSSFCKDYDEDFFTNDGLLKLAQFISSGRDRLPAIDNGERLGSPIARPSKIICIGLNYTDHCRETNAPIPSEPIIFFKSTTSLAGPNDELMLPKNSKKTD